MPSPGGAVPCDPPAGAPLGNLAGSAPASGDPGGPAGIGAMCVRACAGRAAGGSAAGRGGTGDGGGVNPSGTAPAITVGRFAASGNLPDGGGCAGPARWALASTPGGG